VAHEEIYNGVKIDITTQRSPAGSWAAAVDLTSGLQKPLIVEGPFDTEEQAYRAALSKAVEAVDRARALRGKP